MGEKLTANLKWFALCVVIDVIGGNALVLLCIAIFIT